METNMSVNSSSSANFSLFICLSSRTTTRVLSALLIAYVLVLPFSILTLYLGFQQWRKQRYMFRSAASHSDLFTFHCISMQLNEVMGFAFWVWSSHIHFPELILVASCVCSITSTGQAVFHLLTSVEHYLAVVHPIIYLRLKQAGGVRSVAIGCVWLLSFGLAAANYLNSNKLGLILYYYCTGSSIIIISFCSISILCALRRPAPGEVGGNRERADQSKQRAFHTVMAIMGALLLNFGGSLVLNAMYSLSVLDPCVASMFTLWLNLPSRMVLPLLFLHREGKLQCK